jgi:hypothetical protein
MTRKISLTVNDNPIELDYFVSGYLDHVVGGIVGSLKDTGEIGDLEMTIDKFGEVKIALNGAEVPLTLFPVQIIRSTMAGIVAPLKGVEGEMSTLELNIQR